MPCNCPQPCKPICPQPCIPLCPEVISNPNLGCLSLLNSECVVFDGADIPCAGITNGQNLNQVIAQFGETDCALQDIIDNIEEDIQNLEDLINNIPSFTCANLNTCSIDDLSDIKLTAPVPGQYLTFVNGEWVNDSLPSIPAPFDCSMLNSCSLNSLGDVNVNPTNGQTLVWNSTTNTWEASTPLVNSYSVNNGLREFPSNVFKLGGILIENTTILGANFDFTFGTNTSTLGDYNIFSNKINIKGNIISLNESDESTQTKGFRYDTTQNGFSIGTNVFDDFNTFGDLIRIGTNITASNSLPIITPLGICLGTNINIDSSIVIALGATLDLSKSAGVFLGSNVKCDFSGGILIGDEIEINGGGTGNQSAFVFGTKIKIDYQPFINQGNIVFNPVNRQINSSLTGLNLNEKIRTGILNKVWGTFNGDGYYFYTNSSNDAGWAVNQQVVKIMKDFIKISHSTGNPTEAEEGCIRYNPSINKVQVYTGSAWETITSI